MKHKCNRCGKHFNHKNDWRRHMDRKRPCASKNSKKSLKNPPNFKCTNCGKLYTTKYNLNRHLNRSCAILKAQLHNEQNLEQIEESDKQRSNGTKNSIIYTEIGGNRDTVKTRDSLSDTKESENGPMGSENETRPVCAYCQKKISNTKNLKRHYKTCKKKPKYELNLIIKEKDEKIKKLEKEKERIEDEKDLLEEEYFNFMKRIAEKSRNNITYNDHKSVNMFFIMRNYKDAKNFEALMNPELTNSEIKNIKQSSVQAGVYNLINNRCIEGVDVEDRPFHCVDDSRNKYLLHTSNDWKVDKNANKIIGEAINKVREIYDTKIEHGYSKEKIDKNYKNITDLLDLETKGRKRILKELNKKTLLKNTINN